MGHAAARLQLHFSSGRGYSVSVHLSMPRLYTPRDAAQILGVSYPSLKQWIYSGKLKTVQTVGGHHRIPESEIDRLLLSVVSPVTPEARRRMLRRISGRNKLIGRVLDVKMSWLRRTSYVVDRRTAHDVHHHCRCGARIAT
jgi:excisionase family DNA binding protein